MPKKPHHSPEYIQTERVFAAALAEMPELRTGARLLLGCSAGGDSMALLDLCARAAAKRHWELAVVHVDHGVRPESGAELEFVAHQAGGRGIQFFSARLIVGKAPARHSSKGPSEESLREKRHKVFRKFYEQWKPDALLLAHQADDQAETVLMRLYRGAGPTGLAGILPSTNLGGMRVVRPLLQARRAALRQYLRERELPWHDDPSNDDPAYTRNWVRGVLIPSLTERLGFDPTENICAAAGLIAGEAEAMQEAVARLLHPAGKLRESISFTNVFDLRQHSWKWAGRTLRRQMLREWLGGNEDRATINSVLAWAENPQQKGKFRLGAARIKKLDQALVLSWDSEQQNRGGDQES